MKTEARTQPFSFSRAFFYGVLIGCVLLPLAALTYYAVSVGAHKGIYLAFLVVAFLGCGGVWYFLQLWERKMQQTVGALVKYRIRQIQEQPRHENELYRIQAEMVEARRGYEHQIDLLQSSVAKSKDEVYQLHLEMDRKLDLMRVAYLEFEDLRKEYQRLEAEFVQVRGLSQEELKRKDLLINEYQRTITEQRMILEKKQHSIGGLEAKVRGLNEEIRGLLQLEKGVASPQMDLFDQYFPSATHQDFQLQRYIEVAEELTGVDHLGYMGGNSPRFLDMSVDSFAVDQRRLFDCFRDETSGIIFIYSQLDQKFLFVNRHVKTVLGWNSEKFMQDFPRLVIGGYSEWQRAISKINSIKESQVPLVIQHKGGGQERFDCSMKIITKGPFTHHIIGLVRKGGVT